MRWSRPAWIVAGLMLASRARADLDVVIGNGDTVRGSLLPASEVETWRVACPAGARITATLRMGRASSRGVLALDDPDGSERISRAGRTARIRRWAADRSGIHALVVSTLSGVVSDDYSLGVSWTSPRHAAGPVALPAAGLGRFSFSADAGAQVTVRVRAARGSAAQPSVAQADGERGSITLLGPGQSAAFVAPETDTYSLVLENPDGGDGDANVVVRIRPPRRTRRTLLATTTEIPPGTTVLAAAVLDGAGGRLEGPAGGPLDGSGVDVPEGALRGPTLVALGTAPDLVPPKPPESTAAAPAMVVGPFLAAFADAQRPTVFQSYADTSGPPDGSTLQTYSTGGSFGAPVAGAEVDVAARRVSFRAPRFERFQPFYVRQPELEAPFAVVGEQGDRLGISVALDGGFAYAGTPGHAGPGGEAGAGAVRIFESVGGVWLERPALYDPEALADDRFGEWVALGRGGDGVLRLFVAAPGRADGTHEGVGFVRVFTGSGATWSPEAVLAAPTPTAPDVYLGNYGADGVIVGDDDSLVIRVRQRTSQGTSGYTFYASATYFVVRRDAGGWSAPRKSTDLPFLPALPSAIHAGQWFSNAWSRLEEGPFSDGQYHEVLSISDVTESGWTEVQRLTHTVFTSEGFARQVAVEGDTLAIASHAFDLDPESSSAEHTSVGHGRMYFGRRTESGWTIDTRIDAPFVPGGGSTPWDLLGPPVSLSGDVCAAATGRQPRARVYRRQDGVWEQALQLDGTPYVGTNHRYNGIATDGRWVMLGAHDGDPNYLSDPPVPADLRGGIVLWRLPW